jgi:hypothetical protein
MGYRLRESVLSNEETTQTYTRLSLCRILIDFPLLGCAARALAVGGYCRCKGCGNL